MTSVKLSPTMQDAMAKLDEHGSLVRYEGGFWSYPDAPGKPKDSYFAPDWYVETGTITALMSRGEVYPTKKQPRYGFAIEVKRRPTGRAFNPAPQP